MTSKEQKALQMLLEAHDSFSGQCIDVEPYEESKDGLQSFLDDIGPFPYLTADEIVNPHHMDIAKELGYDELLPPKESWEVVACLSILHHECRKRARGGVFVRNCHRPSDYNARVGGSAGSDHLNGRAFDMDFHTPEARKRALKYLRNMYDNEALELSLGVGDKTIHVGVLSENGNRRWSYS